MDKAFLSMDDVSCTRCQKIANYEIVHDENNAKNMLRNMVNDAWERRHLVEMISDGMGEI